VGRSARCTDPPNTDVKHRPRSAQRDGSSRDCSGRGPWSGMYFRCRKAAASAAGESRRGCRWRSRSPASNLPGRLRPQQLLERPPRSPMHARHHPRPWPCGSALGQAHRAAWASCRQITHSRRDAGSVGERGELAESRAPQQQLHIGFAVQLWRSPDGTQPLAHVIRNLGRDAQNQRLDSIHSPFCRLQRNTRDILFRGAAGCRGRG